MRLPILLTSFVASFVLVSPVSFSGELLDIDNELNRVKAHYIAKNYGQAADKLTKIADTLRGYKAREMATFLPMAPTGWVQMEDGEKNYGGSGLIAGGSMTMRAYQKGVDKVEVTIMLDNPLMKSMGQLASIANFADFGVKTYKGGILKYEAGDPKKAWEKESKLMLVLGSDGIAVEVAGEGMSEETAMLFLHGMDIDKMVDQFE
ncbi:MAG: hypothetical protein OXR68_01985 [Alphaproteobacteria bacterium]|nr:hypothetical protein [Alphaproteobacteria bacterium]MDD9919380.1 hypothetical protein [Alphaproteobacteria bacterium]